MTPHQWHQVKSYDANDHQRELTTATIAEGPFAPILAGKPELVLLVGYPSMGKSRICRNHFGPAGYEHISQDVLGTRPKCVKAAEEALAGGKSCVIGMHSVPPSWPWCCR